MEIALIRVLGAPAVHFDLYFLGQLAAEVVDMDTCAAIDLRGKLACKETDFQ
jgi:hypothetical protein